MNALRILILSNAQPSRSWRFANRVVREVPGAEICGIVQRPIQALPRVQQLVLAGGRRGNPVLPGRLSKLRLWLSSVAEKVAQWVLWFVHGCPCYLSKPKELTIEILADKCTQAGWPFFNSPNGKDAEVLNSIAPTDLDLVILLGEFSSIPRLSANPSSGLIRARSDENKSDSRQTKEGALTCVEHFTKNSESPYTIASLTLPWQPYDDSLGFALKTDLIADDLLLQTASSLSAGTATSASKEVNQWVGRILSPYLTQLDQTVSHTAQSWPGRKRSRSTWKLCVSTLLLCSPWIVGRNWFRRWRRQYPVLVLAHHLVSDRPHRMGVPTEAFWRQVLFLQKHYRIVNLSQAIELLRSGEVRVPTVVLTFDDGYADNFLNLRAVATEMGISATLFVTTGPVETRQEFDHDLVKGTKGFLPLTWDQIRYWSTLGIEFGSHTRTHLDCGTVDRTNLQSEIVGSKNDLEAQLGKPVRLFAFPYGKRENMSLEAMHLAASAYSHYVSSFGGEDFSWSKKPQCHLFRKNFYASLWELELELQSVFDFVDAMKLQFRLGRGESTSFPVRVSAASALTSSISGSSAPRTR